MISAWFGPALVAAAFVLFVLELKTPGTGLLALTGAVALFGGLLLIFERASLPLLVRLSLPAAMTITLLSTGFFLALAVLAARAQQRRPVTGMEGLVGRTGYVRKKLVPAPGGPLVFVGSVLVQGEIWRAEADEALPTGTEVVVTETDGFTLRVAREEQ
ncbi:MAG: NfeD family protein [Candidatus Promineifilaceae bacterium]|nr:NfeD family protein [Candidatus Promineifilaceae bacterium]